MKLKLPLAILTAVLGVSCIHAQTALNFTIPTLTCGNYNASAYYCPQMHFLLPDGTTHNFFYYPLYNGQTNSVNFDTLDNLGYAKIRSVTTTSTTTDTGTVYTQTLMFDWVDYNNVPFTGTSTIQFTVSAYHCSSGHPVCTRTWTVSGGTVSVNYKAQPIAQSPIAPTPVCPYPPSSGKCPHDWPPVDPQ